LKYKNINSAIHNFGHSFTSLMNYVDDDYVIDELTHIHRQGYDIDIDWLSRKFNPESRATSRIKKSIGYWADTLAKHLKSQRVDIEKLDELRFRWPPGKRKYMFAVDDRGTEHKVYVNEMK
jgi:hypothetical protein